MAKKKAAKKAIKKLGRVKKPIVTTVSKPKNEKDVDDIIAQIVKAREKRERDAKAEIGKLAEELFTIGVKNVYVTYDGSGDSGDVDFVSYEKLNDKINVPPNLEEKLKDTIWAILPRGFENNDGGYGEVYINTVTKKVKLEHHQRYTEITDSEDEFDL